ncbi:MAG: roadblock/LC7 domain-containing protein, partial [Gemmatimonadetes bacterium]|nr:roadblock/LC7 domain-containing protein [Gemmatimonadota bacterium]
MTPARWQALLEEVTLIGGVRGAAVVSAEDGLVVHEAAMDGVATADVAALATALVRRAQSLLQVLGDEVPRMVTLAATRGTLVAVQGKLDLWLVA